MNNIDTHSNHLAVIPHTFNPSLILDARDQAIEKTRQAMVLLEEASSIGKAVGIDGASFGNCLNALRSKLLYPHFTHEYMAHYTKLLNNEAWRKLMHATRFDHIMDKDTRTGFYQAINTGEAVELTKESIANFFAGLFDNRHAMLETRVRECYNRLSWEVVRHHANRWEVVSEGPVPITQKFKMHGFAHGSQWVFGNMGGLEQLMGLMCVLEGRMDESDRIYDDFLCLCQNSREHRKASNEFFSLKWYKNGNADVVFKRMDLIEQLNTIAMNSTPKALTGGKE